jgi:hypothetical protein
MQLPLPIPPLPLPQLKLLPLMLLPASLAWVHHLVTGDGTTMQ